MALDCEQLQVKFELDAVKSNLESFDPSMSTFGGGAGPAGEGEDEESYGFA